MTGLLKQGKRNIHKILYKIETSLIYKLSKAQIKNRRYEKEIEKIKHDNLIQERKYIDKISIQTYEIRYIDLQMARVKKYIQSARFKEDTNETIKEHLIELIEGKVQD